MSQALIHSNSKHRENESSLWFTHSKISQKAWVAQSTCSTMYHPQIVDSFLSEEKAIIIDNRYHRCSMTIKVDLPPPVHFSKCTTRFPYKTYGVRKRNLGKSSINRQIQKYVANHNKDGPKTKLKMKKFLTALSSVLYFMFYFPPYVLYGKPSVHIEKWTGQGVEKSTRTRRLRVLRSHAHNLTNTS